MTPATHYFLNSYRECLNAFRDSTRAAAVRFPDSRHHVIRIEAGEIDVLHLKRRKRDTRRLILISSGVHGVEGFVGSAIQRKLLDDFANGSQNLKSDVLFVHGINPYGFQHWRRVNERNVDLNRNFYLKRDRVPKRERNKGYRRLKSFFLPGLPFTFWPLELLVFSLRFLFIALRMGPRRFTDAAVNGQFEYKRGIYYGGRKPEPIVKRLREFLEKRVSGYREILLLDLHTGYGAEDGILLIQNAARGTPEDKNIAQIVTGLPLLRPGSGPNFYKTAGDFTDFLGRVFPGKTDIFPLTVELGTTGNLSAYGALLSSFLVVAENRIHHQGAWFPSARKKVREKFLRLFYPASAVWRARALANATEICRELFARFESLEKIR